MNELSGEASGYARQVNIGGDNYGSLTFPASLEVGALVRLLPGDIADFTGRAGQVAQLLDWFKGPGNAPTVCVIFGKPGVGKSALAIHVARSIITRYPDAQLYTNLRGQDGQPGEPVEVLPSFLRALGMRSSDIPEDQQGMAGAFRSLIEDRHNRTLIVLDNARDAAQVRPLLPGNTQSAVLITSRAPLASLEGANLLDLGVMTDFEAIRLLSRVSGRRLSDSDAETAMTVVAACGRLPLAVRISGALLKQKKHWGLSKLATKLGDERSRLDLFQVGDLDVRASFQLSYQGLPPAQAHAFRLLSLLPPTEFPPEPVAAMLDIRRDMAEEVLDQLHQVQLVEAVTEEHYRLHDLIRIFSRERRYAESDDRQVHTARTGLARYAGSFEAQYTAQLRVRSFQLLPSFGPNRIPMEELYVRQRVLSVIDRVELPYTGALRPNETSIVIGAPGTGKTTMASRICLDLAEGSMPEVAEVGFTIRAREFDSGKSGSLEAFIIQNLRVDFQLEVSSDALSILLYSGRAAIIVDGLDELFDRKERVQLIKQIKNFRESYVRVPVIVTSRSTGFEPAKDFPGVAVFELEVLSDADVADYMARIEAAVWGEENGPAPGVADDLLAAARTLGDGYHNPLLLSMLWQVYSRTNFASHDWIDLYKAFWTLSTGGWDRARGIEIDTLPDVSQAMEYIAFRMTTETSHPENGIDQSQLLSMICDYCRAIGFTSKTENAVRALVDWILSRATLLIETESTTSGSVFRFVHLSFKEFGAASWLVKAYPNADTLAAAIDVEILGSVRTMVARIAAILFGRIHEGGDLQLFQALRKRALENPELLRLLEDLDDQPWGSITRSGLVRPAGWDHR